MAEATKPKALVIATIPPDLRAALAQHCALIAREDVAGWPAAPASGFRIAVTTSMAGLDAATLDALPDVKFVVCNGAGLDRIDLAAARARGVAIANTPDELADDVGEAVIALTYAIMRRVAEADRFVRAGRWAKERIAPSTRVFGKTIGIVGLGRIGRRAAQLAQGIGMTVLYTGRRPAPDVPYTFVPDLLALAERSDVLAVSCPPGESTRGLISAQVLERLGPRGYLVNVSRGSVVDEPALIAALQNSTIAGAALDVFASEPNLDPRFLTLDNVVLQPHSDVDYARDPRRDDRAAHARTRRVPAWPAILRRSRRCLTLSERINKPIVLIFVPFARLEARNGPEEFRAARDRRLQPQRGCALHPARQPVPPSRPVRPMGGRPANSDRRGACRPVRRRARHDPPGARSAWRAKGSSSATGPKAPSCANGRRSNCGARLRPIGPGLLMSREGASIEVLADESGMQPDKVPHPIGTLAPSYRHVRRRHSRHGLPFLIADLFIDARVARRIPTKLLETKTALRLVADIPGVKIKGARQTLTIGTADIEVAEALNIPLNAPTACVYRSVVDQAGCLVFIGEGIYRGDQVRIDMKLK